MSTRLLSLIVAVALTSTKPTSAGNILIWSPTFGHSHVAFLGNIADVLTADGHNVTILSPTIDPHVTTFGNRLPAHTIRITPNETYWLQTDLNRPALWDAPPCDGMCMKWSDFDLLVEATYRACEAVLDDAETLSKLHAMKFDLVYSESIDNCAPGVFQVLDIPHIILVSALGVMPRMYQVAGLLPLPSFVPMSLSPYSDEMTFWERMRNFNLMLDMTFSNINLERRFEALFDARYPGIPPIRSIYFERTALMMANVHEFAETPRPTTNMIRYIGGIKLYEPKALTKELDDVLHERSTNVLFSMGSIALSKDMPMRVKTAFIETFASFPNVTFIWKYEDSDYSLFKHIPNIYPMAWTPQVDLLADRRLSLFITHGGMNSVLESMHYGKPMIVVPLFADQQLNAKSVERNGVGLILERHLLSKDTLTTAIRDVLCNRQISEKCSLLRALLDGRPSQYRQDIAKYTRIIIEYGKLEHLPLYSRNMTGIQYFCLDVIAFELSVLIVVTYAFWRLFKYILSKLR